MAFGNVVEYLYIFIERKMRMNLDWLYSRFDYYFCFFFFFYLLYFYIDTTTCMLNFFFHLILYVCVCRTSRTHKSYWDIIKKFFHIRTGMYTLIRIILRSCFFLPLVLSFCLFNSLKLHTIYFFFLFLCTNLI